MAYNNADAILFICPKLFVLGWLIWRNRPDLPHGGAMLCLSTPYILITIKRDGAKKAAFNLARVFAFAEGVRRLYDGDPNGGPLVIFGMSGLGLNNARAVRNQVAVEGQVVPAAARGQVVPAARLQAIV